MLLSRNDGGIQIAEFSANYNDLQNGESVFQWDDYAEHDMAKECVEIYRLMFDMSALAIKNLLTAVSSINRLIYVFRPGQGRLGKPTGEVPTSELYKLLTFPTDSIYSTATAGPKQVNFSKDVSFADNPLLADPALNVYGAFIESDAGTWTTFGDDDFQVRIWYKWVKATQQKAQAYLSWEALGAV